MFHADACNACTSLGGIELLWCLTSCNQLTILIPQVLACCRWKQKTWSWSWTFKLIDETSDREIATLKAHPGLRGSSSIYLYEGQWDPAWVQIVVLTAVLAIKAVQLSRYASYGV